MTADFVTLVRQEGRANKLIRRDKNGTVYKKPGPPISSANATTVCVPSVDAMKDLLCAIGGDPQSVLIPSGYIPGTEPEDKRPLSSGPQYAFISKSALAERLCVDKNDTDKLVGHHLFEGSRQYARIKANMQPGSWVLIDRDQVSGMPPHLAGMTDADWLGAMARMVPGLASVPKIRVPSSTGRVLVDGVPMAASGQHYYFQISDGSDLERFGAVLLQRSFLHGYGFMRPIYSKDEAEKIVGNRQWSIFDPTTFSRERLAYEGAPTIRGAGLTLAPMRVEVL